MRDAWSVSPQADPSCGPKMPPCSLTPLTKMPIPVTQDKASFSTVLTKAYYQGQWIVIKKGARRTTVLRGYEDCQHLADLEDRYESVLMAKSFKDERFFILDEVTKRPGCELFAGIFRGRFWHAGRSRAFNDTRCNEVWPPAARRNWFLTIFWEFFTFFGDSLFC